nr:uncharacterized protein At5g65660 [Ipomoea batatas]
MGNWLLQCSALYSHFELWIIGDAISLSDRPSWMDLHDLSVIGIVFALVLNKVLNKVKAMESPYSAPPHVDASRPSLGFPLGTALLLIVIFTLSGVFSCCYHWDKLRSLRRSFADASPADGDDGPRKPVLAQPDLKQNQSLTLPVVMPGEHVPRFLALPCPCQPPRAERIVVENRNRQVSSYVVKLILEDTAKDFGISLSEADRFASPRELAGLVVQSHRQSTSKVVPTSGQESNTTISSIPHTIITVVQHTTLGHFVSPTHIKLAHNDKMPLLTDNKKGNDEATKYKS